MYRYSHTAVINCDVRYKGNEELNYCYTRRGPSSGLRPVAGTNLVVCRVCSSLQESWNNG